MPNLTRRRARPRALPAVLLGLVLGSAALAPAAGAAEPRAHATIATPATDPTQRSDAARSINGEILIRYAPGTTARERAAIRREHGLTHVRTSANGRTDVVTADGKATATVRRHLADDPDVVAVAPNHQRELADEISGEPGFPQLWGLHNTGQSISGTTTQKGVVDIDIDALQALRLGIGRPEVVVAVIDDGVDFGHVDLAGRAWTNPGEAGDKAANGLDDDGNGYVDDVHGWDFCNDDNTVHDPGEDGHGTHVAGTVAASLNGRGIVGVAPGVSVMALKFIDASGFCGSDDMVVAAIDYAASFRVPIINASWGGPDPSAVLDVAIAGSGALLVAAAGNWEEDIDAPGSERFYPASSTLPNVLAVGAVDQTGKRAPFSNYGTTSVDIAAPGTNILSTYPAGGGCVAPCYAWSAGTSMAAPHVSGVAALAGSAHASLLTDPIKLRTRILSTGQALSGGTAWTATGRLVNAFRAVDAERPTVLAPNRFAVKTGTIVEPTRTRVVTSWPAATDGATWIAGYTLKRRSAAGWTTLATATKSTTVSNRLTYGSSYFYRLTAQDAPGNTGGPIDSVTIVPKLHPDGSSLARYSRGWRTASSSSALGGKVHTTTTAGAAVSFSFTGRSFALVAPMGPRRGSVKVYVDGVLDKTVSLARSSSRARVAVFSTSWTTKATHRIRVVVVGSRRVTIDGFLVVR